MNTASENQQDTVSQRPARSQKPASRRSPFISAVLIIAVLGITAMLALWLTQSGESSDDATASASTSRILPVEARRIALTNEYTRQREFPGLITARRSVDLSFQVQGQITEFLVDEGDKVAIGDVLARLDTDRFTAERARLLAQLGEQQAVARLARQTLARQQNLNRQGHTSDQRLDEARTDLQRANNAVASIQAQINLTDVNLADAELIAPFGGTVTRRMLDEGSVVSVGNPILRLLETDVLEARVGLPPALVVDRKSGETLEFQWRGNTHSAVVQSILPSVGRNSRTLTMVLDLPSNLGAHDGELIELVLQDPVKADGVWLPNDALTEGLRGLWSVYALTPQPHGHTGANEDGNEGGNSSGKNSAANHYIVTRAEVEVLYAEATRSYVSGTLSDGDLVVSHGAQRLTPGQVVSRLQPDPSDIASREPQG